MIAAFIDGLRRVATAPWLLLGVYGLTLATTIPMALVLHESIASDLGASVTADAVAEGFDVGWWGEFQYDARGIARTLVPEVIGFAAVLSNLSRLADAQLPTGALAGLAVFYLVAWAFLVGGIIDRLARQRRVAASGFFAACGVYFWRFIRLAIVVAAVYGFLFTVVHPWLFESVAGPLTLELTVERDAAAVRFIFYGLFGAVVLGVALVFDYAKVRAVVEDRRSMIGALLAAFRFARRRPVAVLGLYGLNLGLLVVVMTVYALVAPGAAGSGLTVWVGFAIGQAYVAARLFTKLAFYATETAFFQRELAHAHYVARPRPDWPPAPIADAIGPTPPPA